MPFLVVIKSNLDTPAQLANLLVIGCAESLCQHLVCQFYSDEPQQSGYAYEGVNLAAIHIAVNLNFEGSVNLSC